jgi:hypothetical protein
MLPPVALRRSLIALGLAAWAALAPIASGVPPVAHAQATWLDQAVPTSWNTVGMAIPAAPTDALLDPACGRDERPAETAEDLAVAAKGWRLFREYRSGWALTTITGLAGYDGMCRPLGFQVFVFLGGRFAGTLAPEPMNSRADGSLTQYTFLSPAPGENTLGATFNRYADADPLCCPSSQTTVTYLMERGAAGPVLRPVRAETRPLAP